MGEPDDAISLRGVREETDSLGEVDVPSAKSWGEESVLNLANTIDAQAGNAGL